MFAKSENCSGRWDVGGSSTEDHSLVAEVKAIEKAQRQVSDGCSDRGGGKRVGLIHVRRMREISGSEMRWRAR